jgi:TRAP-type transport system periplasmic protein
MNRRGWRVGLASGLRLSTPHRWRDAKAALFVDKNKKGSGIAPLREYNFGQPLRDMEMCPAKIRQPRTMYRERTMKFAVLMTAAAAGIVGGLAFTQAPSSAKADEVKLTLVYPFPDFLVYTKNCKALAQKINARGKGVVQIDVLPFNSIKMFQQAPAVSKGRVDLVCTPAAFYARAIPENEAISTASSTPMQARASGGTAIIDGLHRKHFNMKYLGWTAGGAKFRIYMKNAPKFNAQGLPDFAGVKMRDNPIYGAFLRALKASTHPLPSTAVFGALEKGVVDASPWATVGLKGLKWDKFLRHAVTPEFFQTDIGWTMNLNKWNGLSAKAKKILQDTVIEQEAINTAMLSKLAAQEEATLKKEGMVFHAVPNRAAYLKLAVDSAYERMMGRLNKAGRETAHVAKLRAAYQQ